MAKLQMINRFLLCFPWWQFHHRSTIPVYKHKIQEAETVVIEPTPHIEDLRYWIFFYKTIAAASGRGALGMQWVQQAEKVDSIEELSDNVPESEQFSAKVAAS